MWKEFFGLVFFIGVAAVDTVLPLEITLGVVAVSDSRILLEYVRF